MAEDQFSQDITYEILSRLPVKSLARFRCVCKSWLEYINDPYLQTIHVNEEHTPITFELQHPIGSSSNKQCKISFLRVIQGTTTNVQKNPGLRFGYKGPSDFEKLFLGSCNGLTLVSYDQYPFHGIRLALINPVSKQRYDLPPIWIRCSDHDNRFHQTDAAGIGFDDSTNTLKTVCVILKETESVCSQDINVVRTKLCTMVHNSGMRSWREIPENPAYPIIGPGLFAHGRLYWLVSSQWWTLDEGTKVVWFDVKTEEFGLTDPPKRKGGFWVNSQLVDLNGEVGYAYIDDRIDLWILKNEEWVLHCQIDQRSSHYNKTAVVSGCFNKDGDILLAYDRGKRLFVYTLKTRDLRRVDRGELCEAGDIRMYRSSLFSICTSAYSIKNWSMRRRKRKA